MAEKRELPKHTKKPIKPSIREITPALEMLRAIQIGLTIRDLDILDGGQVIDLIIEAQNDSYNYPRQATTEDYDSFFGG